MIRDALREVPEKGRVQQASGSFRDFRVLWFGVGADALSRKPLITIIR